MRIILAILIWAAAASFAPAAITVTPGGGGGVITTNEFDGSAITSGTVADARIDSAIARKSEIGAMVATNIFNLGNGTNLSTGAFRDGVSYYVSNIVFSGSVAGINGNWYFDTSTQLYTNSTTPDSLIGWSQETQFYVANSDVSIAFTNATGLISSNWYPYAGASPAPISYWSATSNFLSGRINLPDSMMATNNCVIYIDPKNGNDWNSGRGRPDKPLKTFERLNEMIQMNDSVFLYPGNYSNASFTFPEGVTLSGSGADKTFIWAHPGFNADVFLTNNCKIENLSIKGAIHIRGGTNATIEGVVSTDLSDGIYNDGGINVFVNNSSFFSGWDCIANFSTNPLTRIFVRNCIMETDSSTSPNIRGVYNDGKGDIFVVGGYVKLANKVGTAESVCFRSTTNATGNIFVNGTILHYTNPPASYVAVNNGSGAIIVNGSVYSGTNNSVFTTSNLVVSGSFYSPTSSLGYITVTNLLSLRTNYIAANFVPTAGVTKFCPSNNAIYSVSTTKTNQIVAP